MAILPSNQGNDPLSQAAPVLNTGPGALDIGFKRMGIELEREKMGLQKKIADDKIKQKEDEQNAKAFELDANTVSQPHTQGWLQDMAEEQVLSASQLKRYRQTGNPDDNPDDPTTSAGMIRLMRIAGLRQKVSNSKQMRERAETLFGEIAAHPEMYRDDAKDIVTKWYTNYDAVRSGQYIDPIDQILDLDKAFRTGLGDLKASGGGQAFEDADGRVRTTKSEFVTEADALETLKSVLLRPEMAKVATTWLTNLQEKDPKEYQSIVVEAKKRGISPELEMARRKYVPTYAYSKYSETLGSLPSESGMGASAKREGLNWLSTVSKGMMTGEYPPDKTKEAIFATDLAGNRITVGEDFDSYGVLDGFVLDDKKTVDSGSGKEVDNSREITNTAINRKTGEVIISYKTRGNGQRGSVRTTYEKFASEMVPEIAGFNETQIEGIGGYGASGQQEGHFRVTGSAGLNLQEGGGTKKAAYGTGKKKAY